MIVAAHFDNRTLPDDDLLYVAFRVCYFDLFTALETAAFIDESDPDDDAYGYLTAVPFFDTVPAIVQLDLLADVWAKHRSAADHPATMVDAAVLWGVLSLAGPIARHDWDSDLTIILNDGPRPLTVRVDESLEERWEELFESFWDDIDFLTIEDHLDLPPEQAAELRDMLGVPQAWVDGMFAVLDRTRASEAILDNLRGLLMDAEIEDHREVLCPETQ